MADKVNAALQIGNVDFHLVTAALMAVDQCTHEVVDFHGADGFLRFNGQLVCHVVEPTVSLNVSVSTVKV